MLRRIHLHPALVGAAPVLRLWALNHTEVSAGAALSVLGWVLGGVGLVFGLALLALRRVARAALVATTAALLVLSYGYLLGDLLPPAVALGGTVVLFVVATVVIVRLDDVTVGPAVAAANVLGAALVVVSLPGLVAGIRAQFAGGSPEVAEVVAAVDTEPTRDIFYIVPDRYGRADSIAEAVGFDNSPFIGFLEERGFEVVDRAVSNYPKTAHSLASTLGMDYLDDLSAAVPEDSRDTWQPLYGMLHDHRLGRVLTAVGYEYVHVGTWWSATSSAASADEVRNYAPRSEFAEVFFGTTAVPHAVRLFGGREPPSLRERNRTHGEYQLDQLDQLASEVGDHDDPPRFVLMHIALPHDPYVFDVDGSLVTSAQARARTREENYARQLQYLNSRLAGAIDQLVDQPEPTAPIVLLQADEGRHPLRLRENGDTEFAWGEATDAELREKFRILSAYHLPGVDAGALVREDMTPVNSFRLILDTYLGTDLGQLEDRAWIFPQPDDLYTFTEVTERVHADGP